MKYARTFVIFLLLSFLSIAYAADTTPPTVPTSLSATAAGCNQINLVWNASTDPCGSGVAGYKVYKNTVFLKQVATTSTIDTGLTASTSYSYRVSAIDNATNESAQSTAASATTAACAGGGTIWAQRFGGTGQDVGTATAVDSGGNVALTGTFGPSVNFGGGPLACSNANNIVLAKYSAAGAHLWSRCFVGTGSGSGRAVAFDSSNNVVVTGYFGGTLDFGGGNLTSVGGYDIFVAKYSGVDGSHIWSKRFGSAGDSFGDEAGHGIVVDSSGNVLVSGSFFGSVDFGGGSLTSAGANDIFLLKLTSAGAHVWSKRFGDVGNAEVGNAVAIDSSNNVLVTGAFNGTVDFGNGPLVSSNIDVFLAKYSSAGTAVWSKKFGGSTSTDSGNGVAVDSSGNVYIAGNFAGSADFGTGTLTSAGGDDIFLAKYSSAGTAIWTKRFGDANPGTGLDIGHAVAVDSSGNVYLAGNFFGFVDFGAGTLTSAGSLDMILAKYSSAGTAIWTKRFGGVNIDEALSVGLNGANNLAVTGRFFVAADFGTGILTSAGLADIVLFSVTP